MSTTKKLFPHACVACLDVKNRMSGLKAIGQDGREPEAGDITICNTCGEIMMITEELTVRRCTEDEFQKIQNDPSWPMILTLAVVGKMRGLHLGRQSERN